jgi:hypothetical protein
MLTSASPPKIPDDLLESSDTKCELELQSELARITGYIMKLTIQEYVC